VLPVQCRMARAALGLSVKKLAAAARVAPQTIVRFERGEKIRPSTVVSLRQVLEAAGVEFTKGKPGVRLSIRLKTALCRNPPPQRGKASKMN
jgi:transcriptional regulator with XRE-family HTH domain